MEKNIEQNSIKLIENGIMEWQPIETAPKDGSKFLMFITGIEYEKHNDEKKYKTKTIQTIVLADYDQKCGFIFGTDRFGCVEIDELNFKEKKDFINSGYDIQATHWMPLPNPPVINN